MISIFLGAGFSHFAGVPLASQLFDFHPSVDRITRQQLVDRVIWKWEKWYETNGGAPEEYLASLQIQNGQSWRDAVWYVGLVIALSMGRVQAVGGQPSIIRHHLTLTTGIDEYEQFWSMIFRRTYDVSVITTNYDILAERGIRNQPKPRVHRPGFHYGNGPVELQGSGFPTFSYINPKYANGTVPLLKLHGSISWSINQGNIIPHVDCSPAIQGRAAIIAPVVDKTCPDYLKGIWQAAGNALAQSNLWIVVGYSLPTYDQLVRELLIHNSTHKPEVHVFDPSEVSFQRFTESLSGVSVYRHPGIPEGLSELDTVIQQYSLRHL